MLDSFCERLWETPAYAIIKCSEPHTLLPINRLEQTSDDLYSDILVNIKAMERRYSFENEMISIVTHGQIQLESRLFGAFSLELFFKSI